MAALLPLTSLTALTFLVGSMPDPVSGHQQLISLRHPAGDAAAQVRWDANRKTMLQIDGGRLGINLFVFCIDSGRQPACNAVPWHATQGSTACVLTPRCCWMPGTRKHGMFPWLVPAQSASHVSLTRWLPNQGSLAAVLCDRLACR